ncbi:MAG TPA: FAD-linked oxidase C-terminal domain-containing protein [Candidatus Binatia bacterium]|jgi:glycolate oxidase
MSIRGALDPSRRERLRRELVAVVGADAVLAEQADLRVYECDGYTIERSVPSLVVLPATTEQVARVVRAAATLEVPFVPRGAGTGLSGGCLSDEAPLVICTSRMRRIRSIDLPNLRVVAEAGVVNASVSRAVRDAGVHYVPDPSSQSACTIGGNVAENSGGPHTLKYGVTTNHVLGVELVLADGEVVALGGASEDVAGYDLTGLVCGSEGTFGIVTAATLRLAPVPEAVTTMLAVFETVADATATVSRIIACGIVPAALEMMDRTIVQAVEAAFRFGFPTDAGAVLIIELDGPAAGLRELAARVEAVCGEGGARSVRIAADENERAALWKSRKRAFGAVGRLAPNYCTQDGVVPRTRLPEILARIEQAGARHDLRIGNVFHAGDGNIHPIILFDERDRAQTARVLEAGREILRACVELGGSVTGEHGIGVEKIEELGLTFGADDLELMRRVRAAFDPQGRANPGKIFPTAAGCVERRAPRRQAAL